MKYRYLYSDIEKHLAHKNYTILTGARQVGKTSLLRMLYNRLRSDGEIVSFFNLEDRILLMELDKNPNSIFDRIASTPLKIIEGKSEKRIYILIDEIQYLSDPSGFLKYMYDEYEYNVKIISTGSSAFYIDNKFTDSLAGRKKVFQLFPLSFQEFLKFKEKDEIIEDISYMVNEPKYISQYQRSMKSYLNEYLVYGGYPAVVLEQDNEEKIYLLNELKDSYLRKDILESNIDKESKFIVMLQILADQIGNLVNKNEIGNSIGLDNKTVEKYVYILEKCFHIDLVRPFHTNLGKELSKMQKIYFNDIGLRNALISKFDLPEMRYDKGAIFENFVYNQLRIKHKNEKINYWRTADGKEVDFVISESYNAGYSLEVKWNCQKFNLKKYNFFTDNYPGFPLSCIDIDNKELLSY